MKRRKWAESPSASEPQGGHNAPVFESLFERSADAIWLYDPQTGLLSDCNQAAVELIGAESKQQFIPARPEDISPPAQPDGSTSAEKTREVIEIVNRQKAHHFEWVIRRLDGLLVPVEVTSTAVVMGGKTIHVVISRDISERKRAERELLELAQSLERRVAERTAALTTSEARLRALVEHAPEAIVVLDGNSGRFLFGNEHACRLYGVPRARLTELTPADVSPEIQPDGCSSSKLAREKMDEALAGGTPVFEWTHRQADGRLIPTEVRLLRLPSESGNLIRASIIDNTERKRAERNLRESEEKSRALFEGSSQGVVLHDENGLLEVNPAAVRIMGRQRAEEMLGKHPREMAPPFQPNGESSEAMGRRCIQECLEKGSARFEWLACAPDGREIPLEVALTRIQWSGRQIIQAFISDITERKQAEIEMLKALAREKELSQLKSNFVSMVSHEFRTPLGIIQSSAELLRDFIQRMPPPEREEQLESITRNTRRMAGMMEEILVLSRLDAGKLEFRPKPLDIEAFCRRIVDEALSSTNRRCPIEFAVESGLPMALADERLLGHIFTNLLTNAVKYSEPGAQVDLGICRDGAEAVCVVRDEGIGIAEADKPRLFTAFHRGENVGGRPGTGLGLLLVKRCVELHHGKLRFESQLGKGTTVTVSLPLFWK